MVESFRFLLKLRNDKRALLIAKAVGYAPMKGGEADAGETGEGHLLPCVCLLYGLHIRHESVLTARLAPERSIILCLDRADCRITAPFCIFHYTRRFHICQGSEGSAPQ